MNVLCMSTIMSALALCSHVICQLEPIQSDYRNIRGVDFIASYSNVKTACGITDGTIAFHDVASSLAMWSGYGNPAARGEVQEELRYVHDYGFNTVRVWLSYHYYRYQPSAMQSAFIAFLADCYSADLHVIPVLWDADFFEPDLTSMGGIANVNYARWIMSPGNIEIQQLAGHLGAQHTQYIQDMLSAANPYMGGPNPIVIMWDAMNEPLVSASNQWILKWITETLMTIKAWPTPPVTCVTPPYWDDQNPSHIALARNPNLNVLSFNFYEYGKRDIEGLFSSIVHMFAGTTIPVKHVIAAEAGRVWEGMTYPEAINLLSGVPSSVTGNANGPGIGFCLFGAMVGQKPDITGGTDSNANFPAWEIGDGIFYGPYAAFASGSTTEVYTRDYAMFNGENTMMAIASLAANTQPPYVWTPRANYSYLPMTVASQTYATYYSQPKPQTLPDGSTRATISLMLSNAMSYNHSCSLSTGNPVVLDQELNIAAWIGSWALEKDLHYFSTRGSPIASADELGEMQSQYLYISWFVKQPPNQNNWWTNPLLQQTYLSLFSELHAAWNAGQYATAGY